MQSRKCSQLFNDLVVDDWSITETFIPYITNTLLPVVSDKIAVDNLHANAKWIYHYLQMRQINPTKITAGNSDNK
jgi:hypothetical protein